MVWSDLSTDECSESEANEADWDKMLASLNGIEECFVKSNESKLSHLISYSDSLPLITKNSLSIFRQMLTKKKLAHIKMNLAIQPKIVSLRYQRKSPITT